MEEKRSLLDWLAEACGGINLSDLRDTQAWQAELERVAPEEFPLRDWNEAVHYIFLQPMKFSDAADAKSCLLRYTKRIG